MIKRARGPGCLLVVWLVTTSLAHAQEAINQATISGRVVDPQGAAVPGVDVSARHTDTNVIVSATTDGTGRFRFPYLRVGPYELTAKLPGFRDHARALGLSAGSAFDLTIALEVAGLDAAVTVVADSQVLETARSQIVGTVPQAEVESLPMNGRNFLDLALLDSRRVADQHQQHTALRRDVRRAWAGAFDRQPAQSLEQLHRRRPVGQRRRRRACRHAVRRRRRRAVPGGDRRRPGGARPRPWRLRQRGDQERHQRPARTFYGFFRDDAFNGGERAHGDDAADGSAAVRRAASAARWSEIARSTSPTSSGSCSTRPASSRSSRRTSAAINARLAAVGYQGLPVSTGLYPNPVHSTNVLGKVDHQLSGADQLSVRYALYDVMSDNARGAGTLIAPSGSTGLDNRDQSIAVGNVWTLSPNTVNETRVQVAHGDLKALLDGPDRPAGHHLRAWRRSARSRAARPGARTRWSRSSTTCLTGPARMPLRAGIDFLYNDDTITFLRTFRGSYTFSSLANFLTGNYSGFAQTFGDPVVDAGEPESRRLRPGRVARQLAAHAEPRAALRPAVPRDDQTRTPTTSRRAPASSWTPTASQDLARARRRGRVLRPCAAARRGQRAALRRQHDRRDPAASAAGVGHPAGAGRCARVPQHPARPPALDGPRVDHDDGQEPAERATRSRPTSKSNARWAAAASSRVGYQYFRGENLLMSINQNVPTCVAAGTNNGCRPVSDLHEQQPVPGRRRVELSRPARDLPAAAEGLVVRARDAYTLSKSMNNLGEAFFSSPTDPTNVMKDWGRSDNDQRHRLVVSASVNSPMTPAATAWERLSGTVSRRARCSSTTRRCRSTSCRASTACRARRAGRSPTESVSTANFDVRAVEFIPRNAGTGSDFFTVSLRVSRTFRAAGRQPDPGAGRGVQPDQPRPTRSRATRRSGPARIRRTRCRRSTP